jgi:hypothetical protein
MSLHTTFDHQQYLNLETFRKNGNGVKTPGLVRRGWRHLVLPHGRQFRQDEAGSQSSTGAHRAL